MVRHMNDELIALVRDDLATACCPPLAEAHRRLEMLRDYREHSLVAELAEKYIGRWPDGFKIMKFYAQAMIENGNAMATSGYLRNVLVATSPDLAEQIDVLALIGRSEKELFQKALARGNAEIARHHCQVSFDAYKEAHSLESDKAYYPLINAAAVADLARANSVRLDGDPDPIAIARQVCDILDRKKLNDGWAHATRAEAQIALGDWDKAEVSLGKYLAGGLTPFQHNGTLRQFRDLWRLGARGPRGKAVLAMLQAKCLWDNRTSASDVWSSVDIQNTGLPNPADIDTETLLGDDGLQTYCWLTKGVARAESVASVLTRRKRRIGTSFVIDPAILGLAEKAGDRVCMMTNYHVLSEHGDQSAMTHLSSGQVRFEAARMDRDVCYKIKDILFQSPLNGGLDCTVFTIDAPVEDFACVPFSLRPEDLPDPEEEPNPRVYLIGYPLGGEMQFSLQDNRLLDHECRHGLTPLDMNRRRVHYFAPTEAGNSGSPVFDDNWNCIALHHGGRKFDPIAGKNGVQKLNGQEERYSANQGIWIGSIAQAAIAAGN